jgi:hypothetical protein
MTKPTDDFQSAQSPFEMSLMAMKAHWEMRASKINAASHTLGVPREIGPFVNVKLPDFFDKDEEGLELIVEDKSQARPLIALLYIFEASDGKGYELFRNLDPYMKIRTNDDPKDGTLNSMKTFPKSEAGVKAMFKECEIVLSRAIKEGQDYPHKEHERMQRSGPGNHDQKLGL